MIIINGGAYNGQPGDLPVLIRFTDGTSEEIISMHNEAARRDTRKWGEEGYFCQKRGLVVKTYYPPSQIQSIQITTGYNEHGRIRRDLLEGK